MTKHTIRMGVDIGGTFTDVVLERGDLSYSTKVLTTYAAPEEGIIQGLLQVCAKASIQPSDIEQIIHGTTLATNALIERRGAKTALITTEGFRDVIEMRTESRFEQYDLNLVLPEPLIPRQDRFTLTERVDAQGEILVPLENDEITQLIEQIVTGGYQSVAIGFLHAYLRPEHERRVRDALLARLPEVSVSISSEVSPQMREYERFNTTVANAYIKPLMQSYLGRLQSRLASEGVSCTVFLMHSGGGIMSLSSAAEFPVRLVESGPAGGAVFAADVAAAHGLDKVLSFDMGGTTAKICLIKNQMPKTSRVFEVARTYRFKKGSGMPISIPVIDMVEIGAGGGSLAHVDAMRQIRVGPESAGSEPGPACFGRGGQRPAITDADLMLGKLDPNAFAGGSIQLDPSASAQALNAHVGDVLDLDAQAAAFGVVEVVDENMANAARVHAVENGEDLSQYTMVAFGGAAPLHAARLCDKLGINRLLIPEGAGVGSAIGFLRAPFSFEATRSVVMNLSHFDADLINNLLQEMVSEATGFVRASEPDAALYTQYKVYMRYVGQGWEVPVVIDLSLVEQPTAAEFKLAFETHYAAVFGRTVDGLDIEMTVWAVNVSTQESLKQAPSLPVSSDPTITESAHAPNQQRAMFDTSCAEQVSAAVVARGALQVGESLAGPAVITEDETSIIVPSNSSAAKTADGCVEIRWLESVSNIATTGGA